jgi:esterase/lipase superfamily enzyme
MRIALALVALTALLSCGRAPDIVGVSDPVSVAELRQHRIYLMTTRDASVVPGEFFSAGRAEGLALASVNVTIPPTHVAGELERPTELPPDPMTEFTVINPAIYASEAAFVGALDTALAGLPPQDRRILLFVHGYNNTTSDAILRFGQFVEDSGFRGLPILFTWASAARAPRYVYDLNSALAARAELKNLSDILMSTDARGVDIFAHSMGAFLTMEGLVDAQLAGRLDAQGRIETVVLASPDIDMDVFRTQLAVLPEAFREKIFLLVSEDDAALRVSRAIAGGVPRVGAADAEELEGLGLTVIDLSDIEDSSAGSHAKFAGSPDVVQLIGAGINSGGNLAGSATPVIMELLAQVPIEIIGN